MQRSPLFLRLALLGLLGLVTPAMAATDDGKILFVSNRDGNAQIFVMNADGSGQKPLTLGPAENTEPAWSPDGRRIAFTSYRDGNADIYVMDADGARQKRLTDDRRADSVPAWTADGRIVFRSMRDRHANFFVMDADGAKLQRVTSDTQDKGPPIPAPDAERITFVAFGPNDRDDIHVVGLNGGGLRNLTAEQSKDKKLGPAWSADGKSISYVESHGYALNLRRIDVASGKVDKLTDGAAAVYANPVWSPDGRRVAYVSSPEGDAVDKARGDIYVMNADGSGAKNLTAHPAEDNYPAWSADGASLYFVSFRDGNAQLYAVSADGARLARLTRSAGSDLMLRPLHTRAAGQAADRAGLDIAANLHSPDQFNNSRSEP